MKSYKKFAIHVILVFVFAPFALATPLDDYVATPDANYRYSLENTIKGDGYTAYVLDMISQSWRNKIEVDRTL